MKALLLLPQRFRPSYAALLALGLAVAAGQALLPSLFLKQLFDRCIASKELGCFLELLAAYFAATTTWRFMAYRHRLGTARLKQTLSRALVLQALEKYYRLPFAVTAQMAPAYWASRIYDEPREASESTVDLGLDLMAYGAALVSSAGLLVAVSWRASLTLAACAPMLIVLARRCGASIKAHSENEKESEGAVRGYVVKAAQAYRAARLFDLRGLVAEELAVKLGAVDSAAYERLIVSAGHEAAAGVLMSSLEILVLLASGREMLAGRMTFGGFMAFLTAFWAAAGSLRAASRKLGDAARVEAVASRLAAFLESEEAEAPPRGRSHARLAGVSYAYGDAAVVSEMSLGVVRGEKVLVSGPNGSGKSTLMNLLAGFLSPARGEAYLLPLDRVSACFSPQALIPGTAGANLRVSALGGESRAYLDELLSDFGLDSVLDREIDSLSSGQRRKVEILQALMKDADLYIFDEPLANIDADTKPAVMRRIFERAQGKALIVVMHGDEDLARCFDRIVDLPKNALALEESE